MKYKGIFEFGFGLKPIFWENNRLFHAIAL